MIVDTERLRTCLRIIRSQGAEEVTVVPDDTGWNMIAVSPDHITLASASLSGAAFPDGYVPWDTFCANLPMLMEVLSGVKGGCDMDISTGRLVIKADGCTYKKPLYAPMDPPKLPSPDLDTEVMLAAETLKGFLDKAAKVGDAGVVRIAVAADGVHLSAEDEAGYGMTADIPADRCALLDGAATTTYPLKEWCELVKALPADAELDVRFKDDFPAFVGCTDGVYSARWMCAPRIEEGI